MNSKKEFQDIFSEQYSTGLAQSGKPLLPLGLNASTVPVETLTHAGFWPGSIQYQGYSTESTLA